MIKLKKSTIPKGYDDWKIDYDNGLKSFDLSDVILHLEPAQKESYLNGEILAERLQDKCLNAAALWYLLDNPEKIPEDWKNKYVYFWGTILRDPSGDRYVLYLCFSGGEWDWRCSWLGSGWNARSLSAGLASKLALGTPNLSPKPLDPLYLELEKRLALVEARLDKYNLK